MNRQEKAELIETLQTTLNASSTVVVTHQVGMTVAESSDLRAKMREAGAGFKVTKNRIAKLALKGTAYEDLESMFAGPTAIGTSADPVAAAKALVEGLAGLAQVPRWLQVTGPKHPVTRISWERSEACVTAAP